MPHEEAAASWLTGISRLSIPCRPSTKRSFSHLSLLSVAANTTCPERTFVIWSFCPNGLPHLLSVINWQFAFCQGSYRPSLARLFCLLLWTCLFLFPSPKPSVLVSFCFSFSFLLSPLIIQFVRFSGRLIRWGCICPKLPAICYDRRTFPFLGSIWYAANFSSCVAQCHFQFLAI